MPSSNGDNEVRQSKGFSAIAYAAQNPDLFSAFGTNTVALVEHYLSNGKNEGRVTTGFDPYAYAAQNADLFAAFGTNVDALTNHYVQFGHNENRLSSNFDPYAYAAQNADLFAVFGTNVDALTNHYIQFGHNEGRVTTGFNPDAYAAQNADLYAAFGTDTGALINHYVHFGHSENRITTGFDPIAYSALNSDLHATYGTDAKQLISYYVDDQQGLVAADQAAGASFSASGAPFEPARAAVPDDYAATTATTGRLTAGGSVTGSVETGGDRDWFAVTLTAGVTYTFNLEGSGTGRGTLSDPFFTLYSASGTQLGENDDGGGNRNSRLAFMPTTSGTYYAAVRGYNSTMTGSYQLSASASSATTPVSGDDYAATTATTGRLAAGGSVTGSVETGGDRDWFAVTLTAGVTYTFNLEGSGTGRGTLNDPFLTLYSASGAFLGSDDDSGGFNNARFTFKPSASGTYYAEARGYNNTRTGTYRLSLAGASAPNTSALDTFISRAKANYVADYKKVTMVEGADVTSAGLPQLGAWGGQCVVYARTVRPELAGKAQAPNYGAESMDNGAAATFHVDYQIPRIGAALVFEKGVDGVDSNYGHVGIVTSVNVIRDNGNYYYNVGYRDSNYRGNEIVGERNKNFSFPGVQVDESTEPHRYSFIDEQTATFESDVNVTKNFIGQLYDNDLLAHVTANGAPISAAQYQNDGRMLNRFMSLNTQGVFDLTLDVLRKTHDRYGRGASLDEMVDYMPKILVQDNLEAIADTAGDSRATARNLGALFVGQSLQAAEWVGSGVDQVDYFKVSVAQSGRLQITFDDSTPGGLATKLENLSGVELSHSNNSSTTLMASVGTGDYFIKLSGQDSASAYGMTVAFTAS